MKGLSRQKRGGSNVVCPEDCGFVCVCVWFVAVDMDGGVHELEVL